MGSLKKYHSKRDFDKTHEPRGEEKSAKNNHNLFIIQEHAASHLHYDFRMELDGVLKSWAVPKGPCIDPSVKRLAIEVEDHPIEYGSFEGIIPKGEYGGGSVLLWDKGTWKSLDDNIDKAYKKGHLRFELKAKKLKGRWDLIRFKMEREKNAWFLIKFKDKFAESLDKYDILKKKDKSVVSGQTIEELAEKYQAVWSHTGIKKRKNIKEKVNINNDNKSSIKQKIKKTKKKFEITKLPLKKTAFPKFIAPELATLVDNAPKGQDWLHEIKFDGYRILAFKKGKTVKLLSRNNIDWTNKFRSIVNSLKELPLDNCILDGEIVVLDKDGKSNFQLLQNSLKEQENEYIFYLFDILYYHHWNVQSLILLERKKLLESLLISANPNLQFTDHIIGKGEQIFKKACSIHLEGIISKSINSKYVNKRSTDWCKVKCNKRQEFVIGGFSLSDKNRPFSSLLIGVYNDNKEFIYCGKVGTGFNEKSLKEIYAKLNKIIIDTKPFKNSVPGIKNSVWVKPILVVEIEFSEWTNGERLRHPSFKGIRYDKNAKIITKEKEKSIKKIANNTPKKNKITQAEIKITHPNKIIYPEDKITKAMIYEYYESISSYMLPYIDKRLLTLLRCPKDYKNCFYQKHFIKSSLNVIHPLTVKNNKNTQEHDYLYIDDTLGLLSLVQLGVLEFHPWGSSINNLEQPDTIIFDLDPAPEVAWNKVVQAAIEIRDFLTDLKLQSFVKSTGGKGLHVVIPIKPFYDWDAIKNFSHTLATLFQEQNPEDYVINMSKKKREGKIFIDYLRNQRGATAIAPYSTRAKNQATVATPLHWDELSKNIRDNLYNMNTLQQRLINLKKDPWENYFKISQSLEHIANI